MERLLYVVCTVLVLFITIQLTTCKYKSFYREDEDEKPIPPSTEPADVPDDGVNSTLLLDNCTMCPRLYKPLCASNGKWYHNPCFMACEVGNDPSVGILYEGKCRPEHSSTTMSEEVTAAVAEEIATVTQDHITAATPSSPPATQSLDWCINKCPNIYNPVCGSNGQWYHNSCIMRCTVGIDVKPAPLATCSTVLNQYSVDNIMSNCTSCSKVYDPVCASNNQWYYNLCVMQCTLGNNTDVTVKYHGKCINF